jgi:hypothetical protein
MRLPTSQFAWGGQGPQSDRPKGLDETLDTQREVKRNEDIGLQKGKPRKSDSNYKEAEKGIGRLQKRRREDGR